MLPVVENPLPIEDLKYRAPDHYSAQRVVITGVGASTDSIGDAISIAKQQALLDFDFDSYQTSLHLCYPEENRGKLVREAASYAYAHGSCHVYSVDRATSAVSAFSGALDELLTEERSLLAFVVSASPTGAYLCVVLEAEESARLRGVPVRAVVGGVATTVTPYTDPEGDEPFHAARSMALALREADLKPEDLGFTVVRGLFNPVETQARTVLLGNLENRVPVVDCGETSDGLTAIVACVTILRGGYSVENVKPVGLALLRDDDEGISGSVVIHAP